MLVSQLQMSVGNEGFVYMSRVTQCVEFKPGEVIAFVLEPGCLPACLQGVSRVPRSGRLRCRLKTTVTQKSMWSDA